MEDGRRGEGGGGDTLAWSSLGTWRYLNTRMNTKRLLRTAPRPVHHQNRQRPDSSFTSHAVRSFLHLKEPVHSPSTAHLTQHKPWPCQREIFSVA